MTKPPARNQFSEPHPKGYQFQAEDCWSTVGAWQRDGGIAPDPFPNSAPVIRKAAGQENGPGPGNLASIDRALSALKVNFHQRLLSRDEARTLLTSSNDVFIALPTDFSSWPQRKRCQPGFTGLHMVGIIPGLGGLGSQVQVMNPLCGDYEWVNVDAVLDSAVEYTRQDKGIKGHVALGVVRAPVVAPPPPPPPPPAETDAQKIKRLTDERDAALEALRLANDAAAAAEDKVAEWRSYGAAINATPQPS